MLEKLLETSPETLLETFHFLRPAWLAAVPAALLLARVWARRARRLSRWETRIDPALLGALLEDAGAAGGRRLPWILAIALSAGAIGLAGPTWERLPQAVEQRSDAVVILLDLSLSMYAEDVQPSRLVRARQKVADVLRQREEGFTALVAYAGNAHTVVPLTEDVRTIENLLPALSPSMMPVFGSNVREAIDLAHELFRNAGMATGLILIVTDGVDRIADVTERRDINFPISILGVGTGAGGSIPLRFADRGDDVLRTQQGEPVVARLDAERLRQISAVTDGRYRGVSIGDDDVRYLLGTPTLGTDATRDVDRRFDLWADQGHWVALLLLPVLLLAFRRGVFVLLPILLLPPPASASPWDDLWLRADQQAYRQLQEGQPEQAAARFEDPDWRAVALYRSGEYEAAGAAFAAAAARPAEDHPGEPGRDPATALYNLGNALARAGDYRGAIQRYDAVLEQDPGHADARFNRALVEKLLEDKASAQQDNAQNQAPRDGAPDEAASQTQQDPQAAAGQQDSAGHPQDEPRRSDPDTRENGNTRAGEDQESERELSSREADRDALEQWLRRVPDDPGGLLRRKFQYETNERLRHGEYRARDPEKIW